MSDDGEDTSTINQVFLVNDEIQQQRIDRQIQLDELVDQKNQRILQEKEKQESDDDREFFIFRFGCDRGHENQIVYDITDKYIQEKQYKEQAKIQSVFAWRQKYPGVIFIESINYPEARKSIYDIRNVRLIPNSQLKYEHYKTLFAPINNLNIPIKEGNWVRVARHHLYQNDLGKVVGINIKSGKVKLKLIPRSVADEVKVDLKMEGCLQTKNLYYKQVRRGHKIPIEKLNNNQFSSQILNQQSFFTYNSLEQEILECRSQGFIILSLPISCIKYENLMIKPQEILEFFPDVNNILKLPISVRQDFRLHNVIGAASQLTINKNDIRQEQQKKLEMLMKNIPNFKQYDYVYIIDGEYIGYEGTILELQGTLAIIKCDNKIISVHVLDLNKKKTYEGSIEYRDNNLFSKYDLVQYGQLEFDIGCIVSQTMFSAQILDINKNIKNISVQLLKKIKGYSILMRGDEVNILLGFYRNNRANVLCSYQDRAFLFNRKFGNFGVIVEFIENLEKITKPLAKRKYDLCENNQITKIENYVKQDSQVHQWGCAQSNNQKSEWK